MCTVSARRRQRGFTLLHLLVIVLIIAFLIAVMLPSLSASSEQAGRIACAANLRQLGQALQMYRDGNGGALPRTVSDDSDHPVPVFFTNPEAPNAFAAGGPQPNDVTAALYLVLRTDRGDPRVVICPSSTQERSDRDPLTTSNFASPEYVSYSYQNPYAPAGLQQNHPADFAWAGDINPGGPALLTTSAGASREALRQINSPNHAGDGQNVLYADGHAEWYQSPFAGRVRRGAAGPQRDNIYTTGGPRTAAPPAVVAAQVDPDDNILLPVSSTGPASEAMSVRRIGGVREIVWVGTAIAGGVGVLAAYIFFWVRRRRRRAVARPE